MSFKIFKYPQQAAFGKVLPKNKIYEFAKPSNAVKELFIKQIEQVVWEYKLSPDTINIPAGDGVQEVQIFKIQAKTSEIDEKVFQTIDQAIPSNIIYEVVFESKIKIIASYKRLNEVDPSKWVTGAYFESDWLPYRVERSDMPIALSMGGLYAHLLRAVIPEKPRAGEMLRDQADRVEQLAIKRREYARLKIKLNKEKQFSRKVEINSELKTIQDQIHLLSK